MLLDRLKPFDRFENGLDSISEAVGKTLEADGELGYHLDVGGDAFLEGTCSDERLLEFGSHALRLIVEMPVDILEATVEVSREWPDRGACNTPGCFAQSPHELRCYDSICRICGRTYGMMTFW